MQSNKEIIQVDFTFPRTLKKRLIKYKKKK